MGDRGEDDVDVGVLGCSSMAEDDVEVRGDDWQRHGRETRCEQGDSRKKYRPPTPLGTGNKL